MVLEQGLAGQPRLFLFWKPLQSSVQMGAIMPVLNPSSTQPILKLHWPCEISPPYPTHKLSTTACCQDVTTILPFLGAIHSVQETKHRLDQYAQFRADMWWLTPAASTSCSILHGSQGFVGLIQMAAVLTVTFEGVYGFRTDSKSDAVLA